MTESCSFLVMLPIMNGTFGLLFLSGRPSKCPRGIPLNGLRYVLSRWASSYSLVHLRLELTNWSGAENFLNCLEGNFFKTIQCLTLFSLLLPVGFGPSQLWYLHVNHFNKGLEPLSNSGCVLLRLFLNSRLWRTNAAILIERLSAVLFTRSVLTPISTTPYCFKHSLYTTSHWAFILSWNLILRLFWALFNFALTLESNSSRALS